jgi:hypothetical protein
MARRLLSLLPTAIGGMTDQAIGDSLVEASPTESLVLLGIGAEAFPPVGSVAKMVEILRFVLEGEIDQGIGFPITGSVPDRGLVGVEVPLAGRANALPTHAQAAAIPHVFGDHAYSLDRHYRHGVAPGFKRQAVLLDVGRLDGDALAGLHRAHLGQHPAVVVEVVLPEALVDEAIGLIGAASHGTHEPAGG